jgi:hypothetical protein
MAFLESGEERCPAVSTTLQCVVSKRAAPPGSNVFSLLPDDTRTPAVVVAKLAKSFGSATIPKVLATFATAKYRSQRATGEQCAADQIVSNANRKERRLV